MAAAGVVGNPCVGALPQLGETAGFGNGVEREGGSSTWYWPVTVKTNSKGQFSTTCYVRLK